MKKKKITWQKVIALLAGCTMVFVQDEYWGYSANGSIMLPQISLTIAILICTFSGAILGIVYSEKGMQVTNYLALRILCGAIVGSFIVPASGLYLWLRHFPSRVNSIEFGLVFLLCLIPALFIYYVGTPAERTKGVSFMDRLS